MNFDRLLIVAAAVAVSAVSLAPVTPVHAADTLGGNAVPGVCMLSRGAVFAQSKVGKAATQRLRQLAEQADSQLSAQRKPLDADIQAFQSKAKSMTESERQSQGKALQQRMQSFQKQAGETNERVQLTRAKVMQRIGEQAQPVVATTYNSHHCGLLLDRDSVLGGNMTNDLTADVVQGLDKKMTTISFNLEPLPAKSSGK